jgi:hypothetical protein
MDVPNNALLLISVRILPCMTAWRGLVSAALKTGFISLPAPGVMPVFRGVLIQLISRWDAICHEYGVLMMI